MAPVLCLALFFGHKRCGILAPDQGIKTVLFVLEGKVLTTAFPEKSLQCDFKAVIRTVFWEDSNDKRKWYL